MLISAILDLPEPTILLLLQVCVWLLLHVAVMVTIAPLNDHFLLLGSTADPQLGFLQMSNKASNREKQVIILGSSIASWPKYSPSSTSDPDWPWNDTGYNSFIFVVSYQMGRYLRSPDGCYVPCHCWPIQVSYRFGRQTPTTARSNIPEKIPENWSFLRRESPGSHLHIPYLCHCQF